jgi:hypothetical protein
MKNYNHFTINYITAIIEALDIKLQDNEEALIVPSTITIEKLRVLKTRLDNIWIDSGSSIDICVNKHDTKIQSGLFGLVDDFKKAIQIGFLISDRVVLVDYLYDRILSLKNLEKTNIPNLCAIVTNLAGLLPLAIKGRIVIIPSPFSWNDDAKDMMEKCVMNNVPLNVNTMSLVSLLSITKKCNLHPYTISESIENHDEILSFDITPAQALTKVTLDYANEGILAALLTEKTLMSEGFITSNTIPLSLYQEITQKDNDFNRKYMKAIVAGGEIDADSIACDIKKSIVDEIKNSDKNKLKKFLPYATGASSMGSYGLAFFYASSVPLSGLAAFFGVTSTLFSLLIGNDKQNDPVVKVFAELKKNGL